MIQLIRWEDSLIAHHSYASHLPQRLDQLVSTYLDSGPWKIRFGRRGGKEKETPPEEMSGEQLCEYNAADCRLTAKVWAKLQGDLDPERVVYEHDMCLAELCSEMSYYGIRIDRARQAELSEKLGESAERLKAEMRSLLKDPNFQPGKLEHVRHALFKIFAAKPLKLTSKGLPSTGKEIIEALRGEDTLAGRFAEFLSKRREALKIKSTYADYPDEITFPILSAKAGSLASDPDRAHYSWGARERRNNRTGGGGHTVSGRLACRFQSVPRYNPKNLPDRCREMYIPGPGRRFVYFDVSQGEPRVAAFLSGDPERIKTTLGDVHAENAKVMFPEAAARGWLDGDAKKDPARGKPCRDLAKNMGLAIDYFAEADRVFTYLHQNRFSPVDGRPLYGAPSLPSVRAIIGKIRFRYRVYVAFVEANLREVQKRGFIRDPILGRIRWLGWQPSITDVANYPIQSCLAAVMNLRSLALKRSDRFVSWAVRNRAICEKVGLWPISSWPRLPKDCPLIAQIHDACVYDVPKERASEVLSTIRDLWSRPITLPGGNLVLPIDGKLGDRWSEL